MARSKKKRSSLIYGIFIALWVIALLAAAAYGLNKVWIYAEEYEAARPNHAVDAYVEKLNETFWNGSMTDTIASMEHNLQTDDECRQFIQDMIDEGITYSRTSGNSGDTSSLVFNLKCENGVFGKVTITEDNSKADSLEYPTLLPWKVVGDEFDFNGLYSSISVTVPSSYSVVVNGITLGSEYIVEEGIHLDLLDAYYDDYPSLPTKVTYKYDKIIGYLEPVILNQNGEEVTIDPARGDEQFVTYADDDTVARLTDFTVRFEQRYRAYSASNSNNYVGNYERMLPYIIKDSSLNDILKKAYDGLSYAHTTGYDIWGTDVESVIQIDEHTWIVRETTSATAYGPQTIESTNTMELIIAEIAPGDCRVIAMTAA